MINNATNIVDKYKVTSVSTIDNLLLQMTLTIDTNSILYRIAKGSEDISGDYNTYTQNTTAKIDDTDITFKGSGDKIKLALWNKDDFTFAISINGDGLDEKVVNEIIKDLL